MAIKKTQLYSILWESCNILRGSMDASQYKNYVLTMLFLKYISDKVKSDSDIFFDLPEGCSFDDVVALKGKTNIGEEIQKKLHAIARANPRLDHIINEADFDDSTKLGSGKAKVDTLTSLISVFQRDFLDFSKNRAGDDDLIGDAYEYLMKNFAAESGKKKGQFYTPAEVSRLMARLIGIHKDNRPQISIYDPTCGSGSLLLRAAAEYTKHRDGVSIFGQELDGATRGMAVMNMYLHGYDDPELEVGDTIEKPFFKSTSNQLETFNYVVANPPFSQKGWIKGEIKTNDTFGRWGNSDNLPPIPPVGYEDYAFLLHIIKSINSQGRGACILPNGVLFRGNEEEAVRRKIIEKRYIRGIISLPANLFFGTGIPACIIIIDKAKTSTSKGIFMIDARSGFAKDGAKNRLREQDIRRVFDAWETLENLEANGNLDDKEETIPHFARFVPYTEITNERNDCNLNVSRYITPVDTEIQQDLYAHLKLNGGLPAHILWTLAIVAGVSVANLYYNQPLLNIMRHELEVSEFKTNLIAMITQIGYALGLLFIVPLGDLYRRKNIILTNFFLLIFSLLAIAMAPNIYIIWAASLITGICSMIPQIFVPIASQFSRPENKGRNVGVVISGLLTGILASRVVSGFVGEVLGWREMYFIAAGMMLLCAIVVLKVLPDIQPTFQGKYSGLMKSLFSLVREYPSLRIYSIRAGLAFGSFLAMWSCLAFKMGEAPFHASSDVIGILGLCGIAGALTASFVGKYVKKVGIRNFNFIGCGMILLAWASLFFCGNNYAGIITGVILIDIGMQCIQLSNQTSIFDIYPSASNRVNTIFMTTYFIGGSLGTFLAGSSWQTWGWSGVVGTGVILTIISLSITLYSKK